MNRTWLLTLTLALLASPFALAHTPAGAPKNYCEDPWEWHTHDYGDPPLADVLLPIVAESVSDWHVKGYYVDGNVWGDCNGDTVPDDYDGHREWSPTTHALISAEGGDGVTSGSIVCWGEVAHHPAYGPFSVDDVVFGGTMAFHVGVDVFSLVPPTDPADPHCGDFEVDGGAWCVGSCTVWFPPGIDGAYHIFVGDPFTGLVATAGHVHSP